MMQRLFCLCAAGAFSFSIISWAEEPHVQVQKQPLTDQTLVGPYQQPEWTTHRRFPSTRVYLQQMPWEVGVEQWWRTDYPKGEKPRHRFSEEVEIGLPHRLQFDLYENWERTREGTIYHDSVATELRWALADWGKIPLNPTLYAEYAFTDADRGPDVFEGKLLLGEVFARDWSWGFNFIYEQELAEERETELAISQALSYSLINNKFSVGAEMKYEQVTAEGTRDNPEEAFLIGPSLQWRPTKDTHLDIAPLFGTDGDAPHVEMFLVFGVDLGKVGDEKGRGPISLKAE